MQQMYLFKSIFIYMEQKKEHELQNQSNMGLKSVSHIMQIYDLGEVTAALVSLSLFVKWK